MITNTALQFSLFGAGEPAFAERFPDVRRRTLAHGAWVEHLPGWLQGHEQVFDALTGEAAWEKQRRRMYDRVVDVPRLVARAPERTETGRMLRRMSRALSVRYGLALTNIALAWYRDGNDSVAMHGDKMGVLSDDTVIATVSVGEPRRFLMRPVAGGESIAFELGWGDLLVMGGSAQRTWLHGVPKLRRAGPRISIIFRPHVPNRTR
ncbi:MAG: alpha-ketoglutarate-dependent dioxygenase AlkB [Pseudomonadota bacterium]